MPFTDVSWSNPENDLEAADFCSVCLVDLNPSGKPKVKVLCKLPVRATPDGPYNRNALRNAASRLFQMTEVPAADKRTAAARLVRLMREAEIEVGSQALLRLAGERG
jgi:hypothetical protein